MEVRQILGVASELPGDDFRRQKFGVIGKGQKIGSFRIPQHITQHRPHATAGGTRHDRQVYSYRRTHRRRVAY